jgi:large subunit ribosomal protein L21
MKNFRIEHGSKTTCKIAINNQVLNYGVVVYLCDPVKNQSIMYAIVDIAGQQIKAEAGKELYVHRLEGNVGDSVKFNRVLLQVNEGKLVKNVKAPVVSATIVEHLKGDKVIVFKKKNRKGYKVKRGHRQALTKIKVDSIG